MKKEIQINENMKVVNIKNKWYVIKYEEFNFSGIPYDVISIGETIEDALTIALNKMILYSQEMRDAFDKIIDTFSTNNKGKIKFEIQDVLFERVYFNDVLKEWEFYDEEQEVEIRRA